MPGPSSTTATVRHTRRSFLTDRGSALAARQASGGRSGRRDGQGRTRHGRARLAGHRRRARGADAGGASGTGGGGSTGDPHRRRVRRGDGARVRLVRPGDRGRGVPLVRRATGAARDRADPAPPAAGSPASGTYGTWTHRRCWPSTTSCPRSSAPKLPRCADPARARRRARRSWRPASSRSRSSSRSGTRSR